MPWKVKNPASRGIENIDCSLAPAKTIYFEDRPRRKIDTLMEEYPHTEWFAYLVGDANENQVFVEDLSIPPHKEATGASAEAMPFHIPEACVGVIHSHNSMGAFHSGTDDSHVDRNYPVSITVAKRQGQQVEFDAISFVRTPCGRETFRKCQVKYVRPKPDFDVEDWLRQAKENIDMGRRSYQSYTPRFTGGATVIYPEGYHQSHLNGWGGDGHKEKQPRDKHGKFLPKPKSKDKLYSGDYIVDASGRVLTEKEVNLLIHGV